MPQLRGERIGADPLSVPVIATVVRIFTESRIASAKVTQAVVTGETVDQSGVDRLAVVVCYPDGVVVTTAQFDLQGVTRGTIVVGPAHRQRPEGIVADVIVVF